MRYIANTIFPLLFLNCDYKDGRNTIPESEKGEIEAVISDTAVNMATSASTSEKVPPGDKVKDWTWADNYFQVYTFSDKVVGLTIELSYTHLVQNAIVDSVFVQTARTDSLNYVISRHVGSCLPIDTTGRLKFYRNEKLEHELLAGIDKSFFVYCTNGMIQTEIKDVVFALDECRSNVVVFRFDNNDFKKYGTPMLCSKAELDLNYGNMPDIDRKIGAFHTSRTYDYSDSIKSTSFAFGDSLYFAYHDDFSWNREGRIKNYYPGREVYVLRKDQKLYPKWAQSLDLFGIPCD